MSVDHQAEFCVPLTPRMISGARMPVPSQARL